MKKILLIVFIIFFILSLFLIFKEAQKLYYPLTENKPSGKIGIVVSILPLAEFVEKVGGEKVKVDVMVPKGASPHTFEPKPSQLKNLQKAKMYVKVGTPVEFEVFWMDKLLALNKDMLVVDSSKGISLITSEESHEQDEKQHHQGTDPHIWLSLKNAKIIVDNIYQGLSQIDSDNTIYYQKNKDEYLKKISILDNEISESIKKFKNNKFMVFHPSWAYFANSYNLVQIPIEIEGKEPSPKDMTKLIKRAKAEGINIIFASPEFNTQSAKVIAQEIDGKVILISSLEKNYIENIRKIVTALENN